MRAKKPLIYIAQTQPGFEQILAEQLETFEGLAIRGTRSIADKNGMLFFTYDGDAADLLELRTIEDLFVQVTVLHDLPPVYAGLRQLREAVERAPLDAALTLARALQPGRGGQGKLRYRVIARQANRASYRRIDAQVVVEKALAARPDRRWQLSEEGGLEFWLTLLANPQSNTGQSEAIVALRLSDARTRHRSEKREHLPASLRPSAAAALVQLTQPKPDDVFLDPMCGAGTLLIERAMAGRYQQLLGGDLREAAVAVALANIGSRYKPIEVQQWDARRLPLDAASVSACAVNLPFGQQIGSPEENRSLYPAVLRELARVLRPGARLVAITGDGRTFEGALQRAEAYSRRQSYPVLLLGRPARVYVAVRF